MSDVTKTNIAKLKLAVDDDDFLSFVLNVKALAETGHLEESVNHYKETPLCYTTRVLGNKPQATAYVEELLKSGASPNVWDADMDTPIMTAARFGDLHLASLLIQYNADVGLMDDTSQWSAWDTAEFNGHKEMLTLLESHGGKSGRI